MRVVVVGDGMVGSRFVSDLVAQDADSRVEVTVLGAESYEPYNRVLLSEVVAGKVDVAAIGLPSAADPRVAVRRGTEAIAIDRTARTVLTGEDTYPYDALVLATGSAARVPDLPGLRLGPPEPMPDGAGAPRPTGSPLPGGAHALRTLDDAREIVAGSINARRAVVIGGGVLGLEAACGLARRGLEVHLVHGGATLMDRQLGPDAGRVVAGSLDTLGVRTWTRARTQRVLTRDGRVRAVELAIAEESRAPGGRADGGPESPGGVDGRHDGRAPARGSVSASEGPRAAPDADVAPDGAFVRLDAELVVLACGTIPEAGLARAAGLAVDRGVVVGHDLASPDDPRVYAIGDCAQPPEGGTGLIAQGWDQSRRLAAALAARAARHADVAPRGASDRAGGRDAVGRPVPDGAPRPRVRLGLDPDRPSMALRLSRSVPERPAAGPHPALVSDPARAMDHARSDKGAVAARVSEPASARDHARSDSAPTDVVRVKAAGLEIVTMGVCGARRRPDPAHRTLALSDPTSGRYVEVVVADGFLVGATCVGAGDVGADLTATYTRRAPVPLDPAHLLLRPVAQAPAPVTDPTHMPDRTTVCTCNGVTKGDIVACWHDGARSPDDVAHATRATTGCGGCKDVVCGLVDWLAKADPGAAGVETVSAVGAG